jgi:hypothetical protein
MVQQTETAGDAMTGWIWILIALLIVGVVVARRGRSDMQAKGQARRDRITVQPKPNCKRSQTADDSRSASGKDPNLEYRGEVYFFSSVEERDRCTANLLHGEYRPGEASTTPRAIDRRN